MALLDVESAVGRCAVSHVRCDQLRVAKGSGSGVEMDEEVEREKLALERERLNSESELRARELDLRAQELQAASGKGVKITGAQATVLVASISLASAAIGAAVSGYFQKEVGDIEATGDQTIEEIRAQAQIDLERLKFESSLILKAIEQKNLDERIKSLRFFANAGLIPNHKEDILSLSENPEDIPAIGQELPECPFRKKRVTFAISETVPESVASNLHEQLLEVYSQWSLATGLSILSIEAAESADIIIAYSDKADGIIAFSEMPCNGRKARIHLSSQYDWSSASPLSGSDRNSRFLFTALLHEAGHTLGLYHSEVIGSIMSMPPPDLTELTDADIAAARALYGVRISAAPQ